MTNPRPPLLSPLCIVTVCPTDTRAKSTMTSARSDWLSTTSATGTGAGIREASAPICRNGKPVPDGSGSRLRAYRRALEALSSRDR